MRLRAENTTWRDDREDYLLEFDLPETIDVPESSRLNRRDPRALDLPGAGQRQLLPAG